MDQIELTSIWLTDGWLSTGLEWPQLEWGVGANMCVILQQASQGMFSW